MDLISVDEAKRIVQATAHTFGIERVPLNKGIGRVSAEDWHCDRDLPPFDRVTMDGIAINYDEVHGADKLEVVGVIAAGDSQGKLDKGIVCLEVMTGAMLPAGADTVIRYEDLNISQGHATINAAYSKGQNVHYQGQDRTQGDLLVPSGSLLSASEIGVGASIGQHEIAVAKYPKTIIISTGNELVEIDETPAPYQIRRGNVYRIQATLKHLGIDADTDHIRDDKAATIDKLSTYLEAYDLIILSGGVSKGKFDYLPGALEKCMVQKHFHRVAQRPGKPLWFGTHQNGTTVFALPGNPVSSFMCLQIYVLDWINKCIGLEDEVRPLARLGRSVSFKPNLTYFLEVKIASNDEGHMMAEPAQGNGSGDLANLLNGDAFIKLPQGANVFEAGEVYPIYKYR